MIAIWTTNDQNICMLQQSSSFISRQSRMSNTISQMFTSKIDCEMYWQNQEITKWYGTFGSENCDCGKLTFFDFIYHEFFCHYIKKRDLFESYGSIECRPAVNWKSSILASLTIVFKWRERDYFLFVFNYKKKLCFNLLSMASEQ